MICRLLYDHRVLTTSQVADIGFGSLRKAQERLSVLYALECGRPIPTPLLVGQQPLPFRPRARTARPSSRPSRASSRRRAAAGAVTARTALAT